MIRFSLALLAVLTVPVGAAFAQETPAFAACRDAGDYRFEDRGVAFEQLDAARAIELCNAALAETPDDPFLLAYLGRALVKAERYDEALIVVRRSADTGNPNGQNYLGVMYASGNGVIADNVEALRWYRLAADQGYAVAQRNLGLSYENGLGVVQDHAEAVLWYRLAADQGYAPAQFSLGAMYEDGRGVAEDDVEALRWYRMAADQGLLPAQVTLGNVYAIGAAGVAVDYVEAIRWYEAAAAGGYPLGAWATRWFDALLQRYNEVVGTNDTATARLLLEKAVDLGTRIAAAPPILIQLNIFLGEFLTIEGQADRAAAALRTAVTLATAQDPIDVDLLSRATISLLQTANGLPELVAIEAFFDALVNDLHLSRGRPAGSDLGAFFYQQIATAYRAIDPLRAIAANQEALNFALEVAGPTPNLALAIAFNDLGYSYIVAGRCTDAQLYLRYGLWTIVTIQSRDDQVQEEAATTAHNLAQALSCLGEVETARALLDFAIPIRTRILGPDDIRVADSLANRAAIAADQSEELALLNRASEIYALNGYAEGVANVTVTRATLYRGIGESDRALADIDAALAVLSDREPTSIWALALMTEAELLMEAGDYQAALSAAAYAVVVLQDLDGLNDLPNGDIFDRQRAQGERVSNATLVAMGTLAKIALKADNEGLAVAYARDAFALLQWKILATGGSSRLFGTQFRASSENLFSYRPLLDQLLTVASHTQQPELIGVTFYAFQNAAFSPTSAAIALLGDRVEAGGRSLEQYDLLRELHDTTAELRDVDRQLLELQAQDPLATAGDHRRVMASLVDQFNALSDRRQALENQLQGEAGLQELNVPVAAESIESVLADDEALISYYCNADASYAWVISSSTGTPEMIQLSASCDDVERIVADIRDAMGVSVGRGTLPAGATAGAPGDLVLVAYEAYRLLFEPLEARLLEKKHLIIAPTGPFGAIPWSMLVSSEVGIDGPLADVAWLVRRFAFSTTPSPASFLELREVAGGLPATRSYLGIGNPDFGNETPAQDPVPPLDPTLFFRGGLADLAQLSALPRLPETETEIRHVAGNIGLGDALLLVGAEANEAVLKELSAAGTLRDFRIIHFATHGLISGDITGVAEPALALTAPLVATPEDDGLLTAFEVAALDLNADFVVLSACNTAAGQAPNADALSGLARAFLFAGARTLLVSHWAVFSDATVTLITETFENLEAQPQRRRADALRLAMLAMIRDPSDPNNAHPSRWAAFFLVGD